MDIGINIIVKKKIEVEKKKGDIIDIVKEVVLVVEVEVRVEVEEGEEVMKRKI